MEEKKTHLDRRDARAPCASGCVDAYWGMEEEGKEAKGCVGILQIRDH